jgi:hypothetical protein
METWELTPEEIDTAITNDEKGRCYKAPKFNHRAIATAAGQKARAVTAWEIVDRLGSFNDGLPICHVVNDLAKELISQGIKRE